MNNIQKVAPTEIKRDGSSGLYISWSDGRRDALPGEYLRRNCPCAGCKELRGDTSHAKPLTGKKPKKSLMVVENTIDVETALQQIWGVGQYALGMSWGDGHDTGIYTFEYLRELADGVNG
jgi:DUF971 family protein